MSAGVALLARPVAEPVRREAWTESTSRLMTPLPLLLRRSVSDARGVPIVVEDERDAGALQRPTHGREIVRNWNFLALFKRLNGPERNAGSFGEVRLRPAQPTPCGAALLRRHDVNDNSRAMALDIRNSTCYT